MTEPKDGAEAVLLALKRCGVDWFFGNAGTDFPSIIEAFASLPGDELPTPLVVPHESVAVGMAHGYWLVTGRPQAVMVHVNVGLANSAMGVINAASDEVPLLMMSGRTPITERGREGSRATPIQYGQEMYDQSSIVSDVVKHHYEMRYPEQGGPLVERALSLAASAPGGPVYLSLPREPLAEPVPDTARPRLGTARAATPMHPDPAGVSQLATWIAEAKAPVILCQRGDPAGRLGPALSVLANAWGIGVAEPFTIRNVLATDDPALLGYDAGAAMDGADLVIVLDSGVPWIEKLHAPGPDVHIAHISPDPQFRRLPVRGYRSDLDLAADPLVAVEALTAALGTPDDAAKARAKALAGRTAPRRAARVERPEGTITVEWLSHCVSEIMDDDAIALSELGSVPGAMRLKGQNRLFNNPHSGGLGWSMPAGLGMQLADRDRLVIAVMGDGSHIFANPVACHQVAHALDLPMLTVIRNNAMWNAVRRAVLRSYPDGAASKANVMPLTSLAPQPDFVEIARASNAHAERVDDPAELPGALARAVEIIRTERRPALVDVVTAVSETF